MSIVPSPGEGRCFEEEKKEPKKIKCPKCKGETPDSYYCVRCGKKLKEFKRFEVKFAIHTVDKDATFDDEKMHTILSKAIEGDIVNLFVEEVEPIDWEA